MRISDWSSDVCSSDLLIAIDDRRDVVAQISADHVAGRVDPDRQGAIDLTQQPPVAEKIGMIGDGGKVERPVELDRATGSVGIGLADRQAFRLALGEAIRFARTVEAVAEVSVDRIKIGRASCRERVCQYV